jgi:hypothetical protein
MFTIQEKHLYLVKKTPSDFYDSASLYNGFIPSLLTGKVPSEGQKVKSESLGPV